MLKSPANISGDLYTGAVVLKWQSGPGLAALAVSGGGGHFGAMRQIDVLAPYGVTANLSAAFVTIDARGAWLFEGGGFYAKPTLDLILNYDRLGGFTEVGAGAIGSKSDGADHTSFAAKPAIEFGYDYHQGDGTVLRPWLTAGAALRPDATFALPVSFVGSIPAAGTYTITTRVDKTAATVEGGLDIIKAGAYSFSLAYSGEFGQTYTRNGARFKFSFPF